MREAKMSGHRNSLYALVMICANVPFAYAQTVAAPSAAPADSAPVDPLAGSYSLGLYFGSQLHTSGLNTTVSVEQLERGLRDGLAGKAPTDEDKNRMSQMLHDGRESVAAVNRAQASEFLAQNGKIDGVVTTASGLQYTIIKPGAGSPPKHTDRVTVHYRGRLLDGTQFDSSDAHPMPATFRLNGGVIKGWQEALFLMKPGAEMRAFVPPDLAYGDVARPGIPPGSLLVFDLELVKIEPPDAAPLPSPHAKGARPAGTQEPAPQK